MGKLLLFQVQGIPLVQREVSPFFKVQKMHDISKLNL